MNLKIKCLFCLNLLVSMIAFGQIEDYQYQRPLNGITEQWHQIDLPTVMYEKVNPSFSDLRIFGITNEKDTIEAPYVLKIGKPIIEKATTPFKIINKSLTKDGHYFTFELANPTIINQILLDQWFVKELSPDFTKIQDILFDGNNFWFVWGNPTRLNN